MTSNDESHGTIAWASYPYEGFVVLVTGAGSGIGRAIARAFLEQGATVAVSGRREEPLRQTVSEFPRDRSLVLPGDMSVADDVGRVVGEVVTSMGRLDVVVANAGLSEPGSIEDLDDGTWERMRSINLDGLIRLARASVPHLRESRGTFLAISSVAGLGGDWNQTGYNATKGAVNALIQSMALDLGGEGVRVNAIAPAFTATRQTRSAWTTRSSGVRCATASPWIDPPSPRTSRGPRCSWRARTLGTSRASSFRWTEGRRRPPVLPGRRSFPTRTDHRRRARTASAIRPGDNLTASTVAISLETRACRR